ncbi:amidase [Undibacterium sp. Ji50W]|uniref:amidase n=1 Tax=Undibacterium sp. Ji50W TaxID=3413041 RepID=UPI003BF3CBC9
MRSRLRKFYLSLNLARACALPLLLVHTAQTAAASDELSVLAQELRQGKITAQEVLASYQAKIQLTNPLLQAVMTINPQAQTDAIAIDQQGPRRGSLAGLPILLKDNIDARGMVTTAGSLALADNLVQKDASVVARLRAAGVIIAGKANLSEWANLRSNLSSSGWSSAGGQTRNPYAPQSSPCGSSSGSGAAVAARLIPAAIGTETDGSIVCPASVNGLVGLKPTVGLVSRSGIVPLSHSQDTAGPMTLTVRDAAMLLNAMAGSDVHDPTTLQADRRRSKDYTAGLKTSALQGVRLGIVRKMVDGYDAETRALFERSLAILIAHGATIVDQIDLPYLEELDKDELTVLLYEFKADLNTYLAATPAAVKTRTMADVIAFNKQHAATVMPHFGQELMEQAQATPGLQDAAYRQAAARIKSRAGKQGIDAVLKKYRLAALIAPTTGTAWAIDYKLGDVVAGSASTPAAVAGYPHLTVPMGLVRGLPVGLSLFAGAWSDARLLNMGYAFEQARPALPAPAMLQPPP